MKKILLLLSLSLLLGYAHAQIRYVKPTATGAGDGTSWANASGDLQGMIDVGAGMVYVAAGIYTPTQKHHADADDLDPRDRSFVLAENVQVYGGFSGADDTEGLDNRNFVLNETILDGDLGGGNNSYHVVFSSTTENVVLDGFTIRNGKADGTTNAGSYDRGTGGGLYLRSTGSGLVLKNLRIHNNSTIGSGGGVFLRPSNTSTIWTLQDITMYDNEAGASGGGMLFYTGSGRPTVNLDRIRAYNNTCANYGGAIYFYAYSTTSHLRGGVKNSLFYNNTSTGAASNALRAGAIAFGSYTDMSLINSTFYNNISVAQSGAVSFNGGTATTLRMYNNLFAKNARTNGDAFDIRNNEGAILDIQNNIFQKEALGNPGTDDIYENNIIETNTSNLFVSEDENDPVFLTIKESVATENGLDTYYTAGDKDFAGNERKVHDHVDIGAFEYQGVLPVTVGSFTANLVNGRTQLKWNVGTEDNVGHYEIERSQNGSDFITVANVKADGSSSYTATDSNPQQGINYYRLKTVDNDGFYSTYKEIQTVKVASLAGNGVSVYPNPVQGNEVKISLAVHATGSYHYKLVSTSGSVVQQGRVTYNGAEINLNLSPSVAAGVYVLYLNNSTHNVAVKLVKQ